MYCFVTISAAWSEVKILIQISGVKARMSPIAPESRPADVAPVIPIFSALSYY